jgi:hypothetical protein
MLCFRRRQLIALFHNSFFKNRKNKKKKELTYNNNMSGPVLNALVLSRILIRTSYGGQGIILFF